MLIKYNLLLIKYNPPPLIPVERWNHQLKLWFSTKPMTKPPTTDSRLERKKSIVVLKSEEKLTSCSPAMNETRWVLPALVRPPPPPPRAYCSAWKVMLYYDGNIWMTTKVPLVSKLENKQATLIVHAKRGRPGLCNCKQRQRWLITLFKGTPGLAASARVITRVWRQQLSLYLFLSFCLLWYKVRNWF